MGRCRGPLPELRPCRADRPTGRSELSGAEGGEAAAGREGQVRDRDPDHQPHAGGDGQPGGHTPTGEQQAAGEGQVRKDQLATGEGQV